MAAPAFAAEPAPAAEAARRCRGAREIEQRDVVERQLQEAQKRLEAQVREVERLSVRLGQHVGDRFIRGPMTPPRAMLGLQVSTEEVKGGAKVLAVSLGGPAEAAGIKADDLIVQIAGKDLSKADDPGRELVEAMRGQEPDRKVKVRVKRDGKTRDFEVAPRAAPQVFAFRGPNGERTDMRFLAPGRPGAAPVPRRRSTCASTDPMVRTSTMENFGRGVPLAGLELATLSEKLGGYFGAKEGVLVVRAGGNDALKLQDGDVIVKIDGREPNSASHATRILRSYQRGEKLQMTILRDRKTQTLDVTLPGG